MWFLSVSPLSVLGNLETLKLASLLIHALRFLEPWYTVCVSVCVCALRSTRVFLESFRAGARVEGGRAIPQPHTSQWWPLSGSFPVIKNEAEKWTEKVYGYFILTSVPSEASSFRQEKKREGESKGIAVWLATFILISMQGDALTVHHIVAQQE